MKKYKVIYLETLQLNEYIEAENEQEAIEKFNQMVDNDEIDYNRQFLVDSSVEAKEVQ